MKTTLYKRSHTNSASLCENDTFATKKCDGRRTRFVLYVE